MVKVWQVGVSDAEGSYTVCICATKEIALREMFRKRDELVAEWKEMKIHDEQDKKDFLEEQAKRGIFYGFEGPERDMWGDMIRALSSDDYENWHNYPHEEPWVLEVEVLDK